MKVLFDTNILIDFLLDRAPFANAAGAADAPDQDDPARKRSTSPSRTR